MRERDAARRPPGRRREHGLGLLRRALGERGRLQQVEPERQVVAVPLDRPEREHQRRPLGEPCLEPGGVELVQPVDHGKLTTVRTPPSAGSSKASSSSSSVIRRPTRPASGIVPSAAQASKSGRCSRGRGEP